MCIKISVGRAPGRELRRVHLKGSARLYFGQLHTFWQPVVQETGVILYNNSVNISKIADHFLHLMKKILNFIITCAFLGVCLL